MARRIPTDSKIAQMSTAELDKLYATLSEQEREAVNDALLRVNKSWLDQAHGAYTCYSEQYLIKREIRRGTQSIEDITVEQAGTYTIVDDLFECDPDEIRAGAHKVNLSIQSCEILELRKVGCTIREIAAIMGIPRSTVHDDLLRSARVIQRIPAFGLWTVLANAFLTTVSTVKYWLKK